MICCRVTVFLTKMTLTCATLRTTCTTLHTTCTSLYIAEFTCENLSFKVANDVPNLLAYVDPPKALFWPRYYGHTEVTVIKLFLVPV